MDTNHTTKLQTITISDDIRTLSNEDLWAALRTQAQLRDPERTDWRAMPAYKPAVGRGLSRAQIDFERTGQEWKARR